MKRAFVVAVLTISALAVISLASCIHGGTRQHHHHGEGSGPKVEHQGEPGSGPQEQGSGPKDEGSGPKEASSEPKEPGSEPR